MINAATPTRLPAPICRPPAGQKASRSGQDAHSWTIDRTIHIQTRGSSCRAATGRLEVRSFGSRSGAPPHLRCPDPTFQPSACQGSDGEWCNGSTTDSDSVCLGSNPGSPASLSYFRYFSDYQDFCASRLRVEIVHVASKRSELRHALRRQSSSFPPDIKQPSLSTAPIAFQPLR